MSYIKCFVIKLKHNMNIFLCDYDRQTIERRLTFTTAFARILGTYKKRNKLKKDQNLKKGDTTCSKV